MKNTLKKYIKIMKYPIIMLSILGIIGSVISFLGMGFSSGTFDIKMLFLNIFVIMLGIFILFSFILGIIISAKMCKRAFQILSVPKTSDFLRDIPTDYSPAIVGYIMNKQALSDSDYIATALYLYKKGYVNCIKDHGKYIFQKNDMDIRNLAKHEEYVYNHITAGINYDMQKFVKLVENDTLQLNLIEKGREKSHIWGTIIILFLVFSFVINIQDIFNIPEKYNSIINVLIYIFMIIIFFAIISLIIESARQSNKEYKLSEKGKKDTVRWKQLKNFLNKYTLIQEKNIEHIKILDNYIVYAISLGEADKIQALIKDDDVFKSYLQSIY